MKRKLPIFSILASMSLILTLILSTVDRRIDNNGYSTAMLPVTAATLNNVPVGRIIFAENDTQTTAGKLLYSNDTLQPANGANVVVLCYVNGQTWNVPSGKVSRVSEHCIPPTLAANNCPNYDPKRGCYGDPRGPIADPNTPYIISPYETDLINDRPPLSWHAIPGITSYSVRLTEITGSGLNWERLVNAPPKSGANEIRWDYPSDVQALQPGREYKLTVEVKTESPQKRTAAGEATFAMLNLEDIKQVQDVVDKINKLDISKEEKYLQDLYSLYKGRNLIAEIREMLESLVKNDSQTAQVYRRLGDIYSKQGLLELAQTRYQTAVRLARTTQDTGELEAAQTGLAQVNATLKRTSEIVP